ncbi:MAG: lipopolysaccharide heptosyltransferase II [Thiotrichales bacterium]|nr:MAG: lipopolysaccharide heptosyltransferase II [Thiotrichales bacterium]
MSKTNTEPRKYLIVAPVWLGDLVMTQSMIKIIKKNHPDAIIDVMSKAIFFDVINAMPEVNLALETPLKRAKFNLFKFLKVTKKLKANHYTHSIVMPTSLKSSLIPCLARIKNRCGFLGEHRFFLLNDIRKRNHKKSKDSQIKIFARLGVEKGETIPDNIEAPRLKIDKLKSKQTQVIKKFNIDSKKTVFAICPGSAGKNKIWPEEYFANIALDMHKKGFQIIILGASNDIEIGNKLESHLAIPYQNFIAKTSINEAMVLLSLCEKALCNDSGLMHIACAMNIPLVAIFGPTPYWFAPPSGDRVKSAHLDLPCQPCRKHTCYLKHRKCLTDLKPNVVQKMLEDL